MKAKPRKSSKSNKIKLKDWDHLKRIAIAMEIDGKEVLLAPMNAHGLNATNFAIDEEDQLKQNYKFYDDHKFSKTGTIVLVGTDY